MQQTSTSASILPNFWDYFDSNYNETNETNDNIKEIPREDIIPSPEQGFVIGMYSVLLAIGAIGNVSVFVALLRSRRRKSRVNLLMTHLVVADMIVTFIVIPLEIGWRTTNAWLAGNVACKVFLVFRAFGLYLSSNVLVCISLDRFFAVIYPLRLPIARKRSKTMLTIAWSMAFLCSLPQSYVFRVLHHPEVPDFEQCVSFDAFQTATQEFIYNIFGLVAMYFLPLMIITVCYMCIFCEISKNSRDISDNSQQSVHNSKNRIQLRRSDKRPLDRARRRTLRMTVTIVTVFACCWMPYVTMTLWYMLDRESAVHVSSRVQDLFFLMAVSNSCMNPLVYGSYVLDFREIFNRFQKIFKINQKPLQMPDNPDEYEFPAGRTKKASRRPTNDLVLPPTRRVPGPRRYTLRYEETSLCERTVNSDPIQRSVCSVEDRTVRHSLSCEMFVVYAPQRPLN